MDYFPYDEPYGHQADAIDAIDDALADGRDVLFEGPCGTGKTLAALAPALAEAHRTDRTVLIATTVHQQLRQFVREARTIADHEPISASVFRGKGSMCHREVDYETCRVLKEATRDLADLEEDRDELRERADALLAASRDGDSDAAEARAAVQDERESVAEEISDLREDREICEYYYDNLTSDTIEFDAWLAGGVRTPDEVFARAESAGFCGYELLKEGLSGLDLVCCNYNHVLDPMIREHVFRWLDRDPEDVIVVLDEAHNVPSAAREHARRRLASETIERALDELADSEDPRADPAANLIATVGEALDRVAREQASDPGSEWTEHSVANPDGKDALTVATLQAYSGQGYPADLEAARELGEALEERYEQAYRDGEHDVLRDCPTATVADFLSAWFDAPAGAHPVVGVRREGTDLDARAELFHTMPGSVTRPLFDSVHATVCMSATLRPFDVFESVVGLEDPERLAYDQRFPAERRRSYAVATPALFASRRDDRSVVESVTTALGDTIRMTPGNVLAVFPSYSEAERYHDRLDPAGQTVLDRAGTDGKAIREEFVASDDATLFTSLWGTLTEGVSYDGDDARTVVVVGVPYPRLDDRREAVQAAYGEAFAETGDDSADVGWEYAVEIPTVRKTRQALGRVIRSPEDFGARILLDERYTQRAEIEMGEYAVRRSFPPDEREQLVDVAPEKLQFGLRNFFADLDAYDGDPPAPR
ncbi:helicase [Halococcoides cellulosivorans]|uniref:Helicase n=2 Tax=Halococcoides cellulosivorans TaxID=1679096 RepID=A0A2R4X4U5_9EURY|nr:helicase [Halococcoides cellulosivorans]